MVSNSLQPHGLQPARLLCPWDSPGNSTGVGCHALLQRIFPTQGSNPSVLHLPALAGRFFTTSTSLEIPHPPLKLFFSIAFWLMENSFTFWIIWGKWTRSGWRVGDGRPDPLPEWCAQASTTSGTSLPASIPLTVFYFHLSLQLPHWDDCLTSQPVKGQRRVCEINVKPICLQKAWRSS